MKREKDRRNLVIIFLCIIVVFMVTGFASFAQLTAGKKELRTSENNAVWDIGFVDAYVIQEKGGKITNLTYSNSIAHFNTEISENTSNVVVEFVIKNNGSLDAIVNDIFLTPKYSENDILVKSFSGLEKGDIIKAGDTHKVTMTVKYNKDAKNQNFQDLMNSELIIDYIQA